MDTIRIQDPEVVPLSSRGRQLEESVDEVLGSPPGCGKAEEMRRWALAMGFSDEHARQVVELFSPPRVNVALRGWVGQLIPGRSFDIRRNPVTGESWGFLKAGDRRQCWKLLEEEKPWNVIAPRLAHLSAH